MAQGKFAAYMNANAKRISPEVVSLVEELIYPDDIFYCNSPEDGIRAASTILERGYPTVFTGGGDGTIVQLINNLWNGVRGTDLKIPVLGSLSLGTGNAVSSMVSSGSPIQDLKSYVANPSIDTIPLGMVESEGKLFPFGGVGLDAQILADYIFVKQWGESGFLKPVVQNLGGYFFGFFGVTAPRYIKDHLAGRDVTVKVTNLDECSHRILDDGTPGRNFPPGSVIYEGPFSMLLVGTCPYYGYGMTVMPFADQRQDFFNLRIVNVAIPKLVANIGTIWKGTYRNPEMHDFYCRSVKVELTSPIPYQRGGDLIGKSDHLEFRHVPNLVRLLRFI
jgi:diacylglycerol kinase family enzyme